MEKPTASCSWNRERPGSLPPQPLRPENLRLDPSPTEGVGAKKADPIFEGLPPGHDNATVERVRYSFNVATHVVITYKVDTPLGEVRRIVERFPISAPSSSAFYFQTALGKGRVEEILRTKGLSLADAQAAGGLRALPGLLEGSVICVVTRTGGRRVSTAPSWTASKLSQRHHALITNHDAWGALRNLGRGVCVNRTTGRSGGVNRTSSKTT